MSKLYINIETLVEEIEEEIKAEEKKKYNPNIDYPSFIAGMERVKIIVTDFIYREKMRK